MIVYEENLHLIHLRVILNPKILDDELLALHGIFAHVVFQQLLDAEIVTQDDGLKPHVGADEATEFVGGDFAQAFEAGDLGLLAAFLLGGDAFLVGVTIVGLFLVAHTE